MADAIAVVRDALKAYRTIGESQAEHSEGARRVVRHADDALDVLSVLEKLVGAVRTNDAAKRSLALTELEDDRFWKKRRRG